MEQYIIPFFTYDWIIYVLLVGVGHLRPISISTPWKYIWENFAQIFLCLTETFSKKL